MLRQTDIPHIDPGEVITANMLNALRQGANSGRTLIGAGDSTSVMIGNKIAVMSAQNLSLTQEYMVSISAPASTLYPSLPVLGGGFYYASIYPQRTLLVNSTKTTLELPSPPTNIGGIIVPTCLVMNLGEEGKTGHAIVKSLTTLGKFTGYSLQTQFGPIPIVAVRVEVYGSVSFLVTSDTTAGTTYRRYNAKTITNGTTAGSEDIIVENGAEPISLFGSNNLLVSPNTLTFGVEASGQVNSVDSGTGKRIVIAWIGFAACENADVSSDYGTW